MTGTGALVGLVTTTGADGFGMTVGACANASADAHARPARASDERFIASLLLSGGCCLRSNEANQNAPRGCQQRHAIGSGLAARRARLPDRARHSGTCR